jgi:hypothetical protein
MPINIRSITSTNRTRFILRPPSIGSTPKRLRRYFKAQGVIRIPPREDMSFDWDKDFFMAYPPIDYVNNAPDHYLEMRGLYVSNKLTQRQWLSQQGFSVPRTYTRLGQPFGLELNSADRSYVVRPTRHTQGQGYRITRDPTDFDPQWEYLAEVFPKRWEYRIILVKGKPVITLLKKMIRSVHFNQPWNHANGSYFVNCHSYTTNRLRWTNVYDVINSSQVLQQFHIMALDVMLGDRRSLGLATHPYAVCEMNFCPSLTIQHNLEAVTAHVCGS